LVQVDPKDGSLVGAPVPLPGSAHVPPSTGRIAFGLGSVWVSSLEVDGDGAVHGPSTILRVDPTSHRIEATIMSTEAGTDIAVAGGSVWVGGETNGRVSRIDPITNRVARVIKFDRPVLDLIAGAGALWVQAGNMLEKVDPRTGWVVATVKAEVAAVSPNAVWAIGSWAPNGGLRRVDPQTLRPEGPTFGFDIQPAKVVLAGDAVWMGKVQFYCKAHNPIPEGPPIVSAAWVRIDPTTLRAQSAPVFVGPTLSSAIYGAGAIWIASDTDGRLIKLDPAVAGGVRPFATPGLPAPAVSSSGP
jgi:hypothetical protein